MTGIELLKNELKAKGFSDSKIRMNIELITAVVSIVSENKKEVNAARFLYEGAKEMIEKAKQHEAAAKRHEAIATRAEYNAKNHDVNAQASEREAIAAESRMREIESRIGDMETPEARDRIRLADIYEKMTDRKTCYDNTAYIKGLAAILQIKEDDTSDR